MEIQPRYDGPPIMTLDGGDGPDGGADVGRACVRQRERLVATLAGLDDDAWRAPSRCEGWTVQDVAAHVDSVNRFWAFSIAAGAAGSPTRALVGFDPKATPAALVAAAGTPPPAETHARLAESTAELASAIAALTPDQWALPAETPSGHVPIRLLVHHALWDAWVHERDVALPLGLAPPVEPDEVVAGLRFAAGLGPAFAVSHGFAEGPATLVLDTHDPDARVVVEVTDHVAVHGGPAPEEPTLTVHEAAVPLLEALSIRAPLALPVPPEQAWLLTSLGTVFESTAS
ncbi:MAG TPA: maleylpyruvate isomerase family mycothiol-dependent enzyme [Acidimicrobiales bacterium]